MPTSTIFYNTADSKDIKAPTYNIVNNSGRPVTVTANGFTAGSSNPTPPSDFNLNLAVTGTQGNAATTATTSLVTNGALGASVNSPLITLANKDNQMQAGDSAAAPVNNKATFTYTGSATAESQLQLNYTLKLNFDAVQWH